MPMTVLLPAESRQSLRTPLIRAPSDQQSKSMLVQEMKATCHLCRKLWDAFAFVLLYLQ